MPMQISKIGVLEIAEHEGIVLGPYLDVVNVPTYGVGHTAAAGGLNPAKMARVDTRQWDATRARREMLEALRVFDNDLDSYEARVNQAIKVPLKQHQFDALVSFDFNTGGILRAKLTQAINRRDYSGAGFMGWLRPAAIIKRRTAEQRLFQTGNYDANGDAITIWDALPDGSIKWRESISGKQLAALMKDAGTSHTPPVGWAAWLLDLLRFWK